jgi:hypothetical protein
MTAKKPGIDKTKYVEKGGLKIVFPLGTRGHTCLLTTDENSYIISTATLRTDGTIGGYTAKAFLSTPESAFNRIFEMNIRHSDATTLLELKDDIQRIRQDLSDLFTKNGM